MGILRKKLDKMNREYRREKDEPLGCTLRHGDGCARPGSEGFLAGREVKRHHKRMCKLFLSFK